MTFSPFNQFDELKYMYLHPLGPFCPLPKRAAAHSRPQPWGRRGVWDFAEPSATPEPSAPPPHSSPGAGLLVPRPAPQAPRRVRGASSPPPPPPARAGAAPTARTRRRGGDRRALRRRQAARADGAQPAAQLMRRVPRRAAPQRRRRGAVGSWFLGRQVPGASGAGSAMRSPPVGLSCSCFPARRKGLTMEARSTPAPA